MVNPTLYVASKNLSSWSFRPWIALRQAGVAFEERLILLDTPQTKSAIAPVSPSGRLPALVDGAVTVWDSLAILEYAAERFPDAKLWPKAQDARAVARSVSAEMHAGFAALRQHLPFHFAERRKADVRATGVAEDLERILSLWNDCRTRFGHGGPFLFGGFCAADASSWSTR